MRPRRRPATQRGATLFVVAYGGGVALFAAAMTQLTALLGG